MTLKQLQYITTIAETGNITEAAKRLFIAQPSLTASVHELEKEYGPKGQVNKVDGLSVEFDNWRFHLRMSNTEPVIRLNVETKGDEKLLKEKTDELLAKIRA